MCCVGACVLFMVLLYGAAVFVLECWFEWDSWFEVGAVVGCQVCGLNNCCSFPLYNFVEIRMCCVGHVFCYVLSVWDSGVCVGVLV